MIFIETPICTEDVLDLLSDEEYADFHKKNLFKNRCYRWSDGSGKLPKGWFAYITQDLLIEEKNWLDREVYNKPSASDALP